MSLGGREEPTMQVVVYGPDGRAYGTPAAARAAGVTNYTMSPPAGFPISYPGRQPYTPAPMPSIPTQSYGGRNRYAEIMSQFGQSQPFSFFGMPSGGFNPYAPNYTGGFTPYQRPIPAPALPVEQDQYSGLIQQIGGSGGGGGYSSSPEGQAAREAPMSDSDRAFQLSVNEAIAGGIDNLSRLSPVATGLKALFGSAETPDESTGGPTRMKSLLVASRESAPEPVQMVNVTERWNGEDAPEGGGWSRVNLGRGEVGYERTVSVPAGGDRGGGGGGYGDGRPGTSFGPVQAPGERGRGTNYAKGGYVSMQHLGGPDPEGPDDGYAALKDGEFVINDKAVKKYGIELMQAINSGKISKGKLRGLLEM